VLTTDASGTVGRDTTIKPAIATLQTQQTATTAAVAAVQAQADATDTKVTAVEAVQVQQGTAIAMTNAELIKQTAKIANMQTGIDVLSGQISQINGSIEALARQGAENAQAIKTANEGVAMALALESPAVPADGKFAMSLGVGTWEGQTAMAGAVSYRLAPSVIVSGGVGAGLNSGKVGGRAGVQVAW
jgi:hypothetical protein